MEVQVISAHFLPGAAPPFSTWNRVILELLMHLLPQSPSRIATAEFLVYNPLVSTCIFGATFFLFWNRKDPMAEEHRILLLQTVLACLLAVLVTLPMREWLAWPAPAQTPGIQSIFAPGLWGGGSSNCFPSHSTLIYMIVAFGFWRLNRLLGVIFVLFTLLIVSTPRLYLGGHYPIDVLASIVLALLATVFVSWFCKQEGVTNAFRSVQSGVGIFEALMFLWVFELAEGFRSGAAILATLAKAR